MAQSDFESIESIQSSAQPAKQISLSPISFMTHCAVLITTWLALQALIPAPAQADTESLRSDPTRPTVLCEKPWVFFDLGDTLIDTKDPAHYAYLPEAQAYLAQLKGAGYELGLITNVPDSFGKSSDEKIETLKKNIAAGWTGPTPFDWSLFSKVYVPLNAGERKPAPTLFERALGAAGNCDVIYQGESLPEIKQATASGFHAYQVGSAGQPFFMPIQSFR